jgi:hypothetical protein
VDKISGRKNKSGSTSIIKKTQISFASPTNSVSPYRSREIGSNIHSLVKNFSVINFEKAAVL